MTQLRLKEIIHKTLEEKFPANVDKYEKERCLNEAANRIAEIVRQEIYEPPEPDESITFDGEPFDGRFAEIARRVLADVKFGYLSSNLQMMMALGSAIAERDTGSSAHNFKVTLYAINLGALIGLGKKQMQALIKGSFLHDIGKIGVPDRILLKDTKLSDFEKITMHAHVQLGSHIIREVKWLEDAVDVVMYHHERWDGTGYLSNLEKDEIPLNARIFAIVDVFDALTSDRPYKPYITYDETIEYMRWQSGKHFDPQIFELFMGIAEDSYSSISERNYKELDNLIKDMIWRYFDIDLADKKLQTKYSLL